jgi:hypothetical protein
MNSIGCENFCAILHRDSVLLWQSIKRGLAQYMET